MTRKFTLLTLFLICSFFAKGSHIVGGDFTYRWIGGNNFELKLKIYRDCYNSQTTFDNSIKIGIFDRVTNVKTDTLLMYILDSSDVILSGSSACALPPDVCTLEGTYMDTVNLPNNPHGYYIVWERCCRNGSVVNIDNAFNTGMVFYLAMPDPTLHNSSPVFINDPLPFICENQPLNYSFAATDQNGDSLVYELVDPLAGNTGYPTTTNIQALLPTPLPAPYAPVLWNPGFSLSNVCGSSSNPLAVHPVTGMLTVTVDYYGIYAAAVAIHEFRNGVEIGLVRREIEFSVIICPYTPVLFALTTASPYVSITGNNSLTAYESDSVCFRITANDATDSIYLTYSGEVFPGGSIIPPYATATVDSGLYVAHSDFCWATVCGQGRTAPYKIAFTALDNGCPLPSTNIDSVRLSLKPAPVNNSPNLLCIGLRNNLSTEIFWMDPHAIPSRFFSRFEIFRSKNGSAFTQIGIVTDISAGSFADSTASDYLINDYCYFIQCVNTCGVTGITSDTLCTVSQANTKINYIKQVSVIDSGKMEIKWKHFPEGPYSTFHIYRKENVSGSEYSLYKTIVHPDFDSWTDDDASTSEKSYCYYLVNEDYCGNLSPMSNEACSILLSGKSGAFVDELQWNRYLTWNGGVKQYDILRKPVSGLVYSKIAAQPDSNNYYSDFDLDINYGQHNYYVRAVEDTGSLGGESLSNEITLNQLPIGFLPSGFTPNEDGKNDQWGFSSSFIKTFELKVFSRWGTLVFQTDSKNVSWNGTINGKKAAQGTYIYTLHYTGYGSEDMFVKTGTVSLLR
ncbi:MAG TPA: gliding motility-associated C-terminal domain-containing protein [Bacteroidia bacterium]|nr:gliding motility-associated C-terminal domain-containing protein [Bacteroidia bacterium]